MTKTERLRSRIEAQERVIGEHIEKIAQERQKPGPNWGLIQHWGQKFKPLKRRSLAWDGDWRS